MPGEQKGFPILELWEKYEDITIHFNDLIIRLRTQALAGVAALSALVGIFTKTEASSTSWEIAGLVFLALMAFWLAIWAIDFGYYNKLLTGSFAALLEIEKQSKTSKTIDAIRLSTLVRESLISGLKFDLRWEQKLCLTWGRWAFYIIVMCALLGGAIFSFYTYAHS